MRQHTGQVIGGVSPIAHPAPVPTWLDSQLQQYDVVWAAAGHPAAVFSTTYDELARMTGAPDHRGGVMEIWLNPTCRSAAPRSPRWTRPASSYTVRRYLDDAPTPAELAEVLDRLGLDPWDSPALRRRPRRASTCQDR